MRIESTTDKGASECPASGGGVLLKKNLSLSALITQSQPQLLGHSNSNKGEQLLIQ